MRVCVRCVCVGVFQFRSLPRVLRATRTESKKNHLTEETLDTVMQKKFAHTQGGKWIWPDCTDGTGAGATGKGTREEKKKT